MAIVSLKDLYLDELADLYDAESQMIRALPRLVDAAQAPELKETLAKHCNESRLHLERLQLIFTHWGEKVRSGRCAGLAGIVQEADDRVNDAETGDARDAAIIGVAQRIEHYEIAAYGCARTYARRLNRTDEARLLQETLDDEGRADHRLTEIAEAHINDDARLETDFVPPEGRASGALPASDADALPDWLLPSVDDVVAPDAARMLSDRRPSFIDEFAPRFDTGAPRRDGEARATSEDETPTPPHGEKLR
jgi:ferritin-like metal-binding protein YciE